MNRVDQRVQALHRDLNNHIIRLYRGEDIGAVEALPLLHRAFNLADVCCGLTDCTRVEDVWEAMDEAMF